MDNERQTDVRPTEARPGEPPRTREWRANDEPEHVAPSRAPSLWDRFLHLMGVVGPDRRGGPGG